MKQLESIRVVQFFLFGKEEVRIDRVSGIFGHNGSGKSSFLDAVQIAMTGANKNILKLNAQADEGGKSERTINDYCLGKLGDDDYARDDALTYITLVWRDDQTQKPTTSGVCISASRERSKEEVLGCYLIEGVDIALDDHLSIVNGEERPLPFNEFKRRLKVQALLHNQDEVFFDSSSRYVDALLYALRPSSSTIQREAFLKAFTFALKMRFDKSVDNLVRDGMLEARPVRIDKFRELTNSFRDLSRLIKSVEKKVADGEKVEQRFKDLAASQLRFGGWQVLYADASQQQAEALAYDAFGMKIALEESQKEEQKRLEKAKKSVSEADNSWKDHQRLMNNNTAHLKREELNTNLRAKQQVGRNAENSFTKSLQLMQNPLISLSREYSDELGEMVAQAELAMNPVLLAPFTLADNELCERLNKVHQVIKQGFELAQSKRGEFTQDLADVENQLQDLKDNKIRVASGKTPLTDNTTSLRRHLSDHGVTAEPICDLIKISDPSWQVAVESFLRNNLEALLVDGEKRETKAFELTRQITKLYGTKVVMASRQRQTGHVASTRVASLITGTHPAASAFVQQLLGDLEMASTTDEALGKHRSLTKDGMLKMDSSFERLRPLQPHQLRIGFKDQEEQAQRLREAEQQLSLKQNQLKKALIQVNTLIGELAFLATCDNLTDDVLTERRAVISARNEIESIKLQIQDLAGSNYELLLKIDGELTTALTDARKVEADLLVLIGRIDEQASQAARAVEHARDEADELDKKAKQVSATVLHDKDWVALEWDRLLLKHPNDFKSISAYCMGNLNTFRGKAENLEKQALSDCAGFVVAHRENVTGNTMDWRNCWAWLTGVLTTLRETELKNYHEQMEEAYATAQLTFRNDVAMALRNHLNDLDTRFNRLNAVLRKCPAFSNGERYQFHRELRPEHKALYDFLAGIEQYGPNEDLLGSAGDIPDTFRALLEDDDTASSHDGPLDDYRKFYDFDVEIQREDPESKTRKRIGMLSKRAGSGSGGEHRAPLYVIAGAALASAYNLDKGERDGMGLLLLDEAFNKMDFGNIIATMQYFEDLGLQVLMASPGENFPPLNAFLHRYYDIARDYMTVELDGHTITEDARALFRGDLPQFNKALLSEELARMSAEGVAA